MTKHSLVIQTTLRMHPALTLSPKQRGMSFLELLVGLSIGLLVVAVAIGALLVSRNVSSNVSDASGLQQQGAHTLRVLGQQLRQAGSLYLNPDPTGTAPTDVLSAVVFEIKALGQSGGNNFELQNILAGGDDTLTTGFRRYKDNVFIADNATNSTVGTDFLARNCVGAPANTKTDERIESIFTLADGNLRCRGNGVVNAQPITQNVAQFQVVYLVQTVVGGSGTTVQYRKGSSMPTDTTDPTWRRVQGVQVCLVLYGSDAIDMPQGSSYTDCDGQSIDMTQLPSPRTNRMHMLFRNTFQLRSQGLPIL